jgi:hypothetical protein
MLIQRQMRVIGRSGGLVFHLLCCSLHGDPLCTRVAAFFSNQLYQLSFVLEAMMERAQHG